MAETPMTQVPATEVPAAQMPISGTESMFNVEVESEEKPRFPTETELSFDEGISADTVRTLIEFAADDLAMPQPEVALLDSEGNLLPADSRVSQKKWAMKLSTSPADSEKILEQVSLKLDSTPVWPSSSKIGSKVAGDMQTMAVSAILFCLIGIVGYIWFRFQSVAFGVAAVVALIHDVLVTLGAIALSLWLAPAFGFLQITEFKISLPVVAAFLTIIGYSLNDTIVIFDRIREVRGKDPHLTPEMVNLSINQTLGRTLLTSLTTLIVVAILYFIGGEGIHSFSFSLVVGVIAGTYSTIFIACPVLLWLMNREQSKAKA
ncbi:protein translocase subunit SecF [Bremerella cremea]|uniref:Protein translocase subunit SecF n=2 Tax=Bremerella cremea TaxID=1031537 RepID=A0A368KM11_9BACT|nr:protein translocase subunit SecF [Bremerella cremea]